MIELAHPWWLLTLPLPYLVYKFMPAYRTRRAAVKVPFFDVLNTLIPDAPSEGAVKLRPSWWQRIALLTTWLMLVFAMTQPMWLGKSQTRTLIGRDVMIVVDLSGSMAEKDFLTPYGEKHTRLDAVKQVLAQFSQHRDGDRLGLILFGDAAYLQAPFTADHEAWLALLDETQVGMAGQSTHLGDAIGLAIKVFNDQADAAKQAATQQGSAVVTRPVKEKVVIVLTDGNDTDSLVPPIDAAKVAASRDIRIHMIAMGDPRTVGEQALDMEVIEQVASLTGGQSFQALSPVELTRVYKKIGELEPQQYDSTTYRPKTSMHFMPIMLALVIYLFAFSLTTWHAKRKQSHKGSKKSAISDIDTQNTQTDNGGSHV
ncbi:VWA domain-containing protein [Photobacterium profundum]|uniref:vWA domain-containing protein n=1 Tax=Photobacterium profundum TaxID=74109 RepID=UPI003D0AC69E